MKEKLLSVILPLSSLESKSPLSRLKRKEKRRADRTSAGRSRRSSLLWAALLCCHPSQWVPREAHRERHQEAHQELHREAHEGEWGLGERVSVLGRGGGGGWGGGGGVIIHFFPSISLVHLFLFFSFFYIHIYIYQSRLSGTLSKKKIEIPTSKCKFWLKPPHPFLQE